MDRRSFCIGMLALAKLGPVASAQYGAEHSSTSAIWDGSSETRFVLNDPLEHPFYWWPQTLLSYPIAFHQDVDLNRLRLTRVDTAEAIPIQFSEMVRDKDGLRSAVVHFVSDLPSGARREFVLTAADAPAAHPAQVTAVQEGNTIVLDSGVMRVRIPGSQAIHGEAPGPIMQVSRGGAWVGESTFTLVDERVLDIAANRVADGPVFIAYELTYKMEHGSRYIARIQCNAGFDFVRLQENMDGLRPGAVGTIETTWTGFEVTHRQTPNHPTHVPDEVHAYDDYAWEAVDAPDPRRDVRLGSSLPIFSQTLDEGELPVVLGNYQASTASIVGTSASFWGKRSGDALGIFIDKVSEWQDHEYAYELGATTLQVRYYYRNGVLAWKWALARGHRSTCVTFYDHEKDKLAMRLLEQGFQGVQQDGETYKILLNFTSHSLFLQNRYGTLDLNCVKDWVLEYPDSALRPPVIFAPEPKQDATELVRRVMTSNYVSTLAVTGTREDGGFNPVRDRWVLGWWIGDFNCLSVAMTPRQRRRMTAMYLLFGYVHAGEDYMPTVTMLSGHPNFFGDAKGVLPGMSFLFPDHPMAKTWLDQWQKCMELIARYNTRPAVAEWDAYGGRWTENLGTYVWAFLRPSLHADFLARQYDGVERFVTPQLKQLADWLVNALSAPFDGETEEAFKTVMALDYGHEWGVLAPGKGPRRVHPPIGAHAERRIPPRSLWDLGMCLQRYAPLAAEHAMWAAHPTDQDMETVPNGQPPWMDIMYRRPDNRGTDPHLESRKYTGYGVVLRAAVGKPEEVSIHLQQIDEGPNYRWGRAAEGGCGVIYFFAAGKAYSYNGSEDVGDRRDQDVDFCSNFGVYKDGFFRSIGQNVLSRPMYNLGVGQFTEIVPRQSPVPYSAPDYVSRSILLAGHDYFVLYDALADQSLEHRLSWFVRRGSPLPTIKLVRGDGGDARQTHRTDLQTDATTGVWFDGVGDSMAVVSHRKDIQVDAMPYGCRVQSESMDDLVFQSPQSSVEFHDGSASFNGTAGLIRRRQDGVEFAMFHGIQIGVSGFVFMTPDTELGISGVIVSGRPPRGEYYAPSSSTVVITSPSPALRLYVDGKAQTGVQHEDGILFRLEAGHGQWELTESLPVPIAPVILRTENHAGGGRIFAGAVASATRYRFELSKDNGITWSTVGLQGEPVRNLVELASGEKVHVRAVAINDAHESDPGPEYPLYVTSDPPLPPDGLSVQLSDGAATLSWGEVLGVTEYRLYRRAIGTESYRLIYRGMRREYRDAHIGIKAVAAVPYEPGGSTSGLLEYSVAAVNGNGEGPRSRVADSNPQSWRNWDPRPGEPFRRVYSYPPDSRSSPDVWPRYYPS